MRAWPRVAVPLVLAAATAASAVAVLASRGGYDGPLLPCREIAVRSGGVCRLFDTERPIGTEPRRSSLAEASRVAEFAIFLPNYLPPALAGHEPEFWLSGRQLAVRYRDDSRSGLAITYALWPPGRDPAEFYRSAPREFGVGRTTTVAGWPAFVMARHASHGMPPTSEVDVTFDRTEVRLFGRIPLEDLLQVAESLERVG